MAKEEKKDKVLAVTTAVYKVNLHCPKCAHDIKRPLLRTQGVQGVDVKFDSSEVTVKGAIDPKKIHERLEKWSKRKVEILPQAKIKIAEEKSVKEKVETKKEVIKTTTIKAYMHCDQCERDLQKRLLKHEGIHSVKTDTKAQIITIEGTIESEKLLAYMRKRVHKHAEIIAPKEAKKEEKKEKEVKVEVKSTESTKIVEFKEEKKVEAKTKEGSVPYFVHYVYAPQLFSDENPNACSVM
ncbi:hypothetical protein RJ639_015318 [Escallonia herrerae]|uniref:HMA domain-containing protein n=1 Tax=Escallonia herrerae TaxID=1293975 RepID=A0AA89ANA8_9ASTE|nr:hypothetical protein RJ639_015318 [Escallonia herrerae]